MLRFLLKLLSFFSGRRLLTPDQADTQRLELEALRAKQFDLESLVSKLRSEMKRQQVLAQENLNAQLSARAQALKVRQFEIERLKETLTQLDQSVDIETQRRIKENHDLLSQLTWLSGTIAHDFRAPLRAIDAYSFFLGDELGDNALPEASKSLEEIRRNGKRMGVLLDALIEYLRLSVCPLNIQLHDLNETLVQVINEHFDFSPVPIEIQVDGKWRFDKPLMMKAFKALIDNAVKFSKPVQSPKILIRQSSADNLEIIDNGVGFSDSHDSKKFKLFHRMHGNDEYEGEGIGLATAERIASRHHIKLNLTCVGNQTVASLQLTDLATR